MAQVGFKFLVLLPPKHRDYRPAPPCLPPPVLGIKPRALGMLSELTTLYGAASSALHFVNVGISFTNTVNNVQVKQLVCEAAFLSSGIGILMSQNKLYFL